MSGDLQLGSLEGPCSGDAARPSKVCLERASDTTIIVSHVAAQHTTSLPTAGDLDQVGCTLRKQQKVLPSIRQVSPPRRTDPLPTAVNSHKGAAQQHQQQSPRVEPGSPARGATGARDGAAAATSRQSFVMRRRVADETAMVLQERRPQCAVQQPTSQQQQGQSQRPQQQ